MFREGRSLTQSRVGSCSRSPALSRWAARSTALLSWRLATACIGSEHQDLHKISVGGSAAGIAPYDCLEQLFVGESLAPVLDQHGKDAVLVRRQMDGLPVDRHLLADEVNTQRAVVKDGHGSLTPCVPERSAPPQ